MLFEINKKEVTVKPKKPLEGRMEDNRWARDKEVFGKLLCSVDRTRDWEDDDRAAYELRQKQGGLLDAFVDAMEEQVRGERRGAGRQAAEDGADRLCLDATVAFLDHREKHTAYESAWISRRGGNRIVHDGAGQGRAVHDGGFGKTDGRGDGLDIRGAGVRDADAVHEGERRGGGWGGRPGDVPADAERNGRVGRHDGRVGGRDEDGVGRVVDGAGGGFRGGAGNRAGAVRRGRQRRHGGLFGFAGRRQRMVGEGRRLGRAAEGRTGRQARQPSGSQEGGYGAVGYRAEAVRKYGAAVERFGEAVLVLMHTSGGMAARWWEMMEMRHTKMEGWCVLRRHTTRGSTAGRAR